jgi:hypothetical protein
MMHVFFVEFAGRFDTSFPLNIRVEAGYISGYDLYELGGKGHVGSR